MVGGVCAFCNSLSDSIFCREIGPYWASSAVWSGSYQGHQVASWGVLAQPIEPSIATPTTRAQHLAEMLCMAECFDEENWPARTVERQRWGGNYSKTARTNPRQNVIGRSARG